MDWKSNFKFSKYIYSTDGKAVQGIITEEPTLENLVYANQGIGDDFTGYLNKRDSLHFLWYICKKQDSDKAWHIDGILTSINRTDISQTDYADDIDTRYPEETFIKDTTDVNRTAHVEVDIHQQEHKDWNEIKTSIHLRDSVITEIFLPIDYQAQADDFDIRVGTDYEYVTEQLSATLVIDDRTFILNTAITHEPLGIRIIIYPNNEAIRYALSKYADGITYEIHSYVSNTIPNDVIWGKLKETSCTTSPFTDIYGQITSAFIEDEIKF